jgi:Gpi18-like mannosyltransferase
LLIGSGAGSIINPLDSFYESLQKNLISFVVKHDSGIYISIAQDGYSLKNLSYGFFPLFPLLIKIVHYVISNYIIAGVIISNISSCLSLIFLYKLCRLDMDKAGSLRAVKFVILAPASFLLSNVLAEAPLLLFFILSIYFGRKEKWWLAGIFGFLAALTKSVGIWIILPLLIEYLDSKKIGQIIKNKSGFKKLFSLKALWLLLIPLGPFVYMLYSKFTCGDFWVYYRLQSTHWHHVFTNPIVYIYEAFSLRIAGHYTFNAVFVLLVFLLIFLTWRKIRLSYSVFSLVLILFILTSGGDIMTSMMRYFLPIFPIYIMLSLLANNRNKEEYITIFLVFTQSILVIFWSLGRLFI